MLLSSCIPSVNPFYTNKDTVFDDRLLGVWQEKNADGEPQVWEYEHARGKTYKLTVTEPHGKRGEFTAQLFKLKGTYFLDLIPQGCEYPANQAGLLNAAMFPGHLLLQVPQFEPELQLAGCNYDWLEKYLRENPGGLAYHEENKRFLLTDSTQNLQKFVLKHLTELFNSPGTLTRK